MNALPAGKVQVDLEPPGRRVEVEVGTTVLTAAQAVRAGIVAICGGNGACGSCRVRVVKGELSPPSAAEVAVLTAGELSAGARLACQARPVSDCRVHLPQASLSASQRFAFEGSVPLGPGVLGGPDAPVETVVVSVDPPRLDDLRSDATRFREALVVQGWALGATPVEVLAELPGCLRAERWSAQAIISHRDDGAPRLVGVLPPRSAPLGLAVDLGTTKLAGYLVRLGTAEVLSQGGAMNPQVAFGEDVLSRIASANETPANARLLRESVVESCNALIGRLCAEAACSARDIVDVVIVGNTAMHHLLLGLPVRQLGEAPYVPAASEEVQTPASSLGLAVNPGARCYLPPIVAGFVGADHLAMLLATNLSTSGRTALGLDIGTNTEISLAKGDELWSCSTASGPAFEGAHIRQGMRAAPGAIEHVRYLGDRFFVQTIDDEPPVGICGSGILDAVAEGRRSGIIDRRGALSRDHPLVSHTEYGPTCLLVSAEEAGCGRDVIFTRSDVNEIQLAKGAIRAGAEVLMAVAGLSAASLDEVVIAGAFGTYLDLESAIAIGLLPKLPNERFRQVGNAAGLGAIEMLLSRRQRSLSRTVAGRSHYVELTVHPGFVDTFAAAMEL
ncbi:MAG TPA: ASKHA domain-containing protein [Acidimicrobiales bacterium]|nr:ASKHA domain-containing protein [Acidimicrobiales bacterium]